MELSRFFRERHFLDLLLIELFREIFQSSTCLKGLGSSDASAIAARLLIALRSQQGRLFCTHSKGSNFMWVPHLFIAGLSLPRNWIPTRTQPRFSIILISSWYGIWVLAQLESWELQKLIDSLQGWWISRTMDVLVDALHTFNREWHVFEGDVLQPRKF
jgi:hypothetical protein